MNLVSDKNS